MKTFSIVLFSFLAMSLFASTASATNYYTKTTCGNGYGDAYTITQVDDQGCLIRIVGVNCEGVNINWTPPPRIVVVADPGGAYTNYIDAGTTWYCKVKLSSLGNVDNAWGRLENGDYYVY